MKNTYYLALDDTERTLLIRILNNIRNRLINQNKYTDGVDDVLIKIIAARKKNFKILYAED